MIKFKDILKEEKILVPRNLETRDEDYKRVVYQKIQDYIKQGSKGDLDLSQAPITKLPDNLIKVGGYLDLWGSKIESLDNLQTVEKSLSLTSSQIQSLGNLQTVGGYLNLEATPLSKKYSKEEISQMLKDKGIEVKGEIYI